MGHEGKKAILGRQWKADTRQPLEDWAFKQAAQFLGEELVRLLLTPLMRGDMPQTDRIRRSVKLIQKERERFNQQDIRRR